MISPLHPRLTCTLSIALLLLTSTFSESAHAAPLPPGVQASRPCSGPPATNLPLSRSVDAFSDAVYNLDLGSEQGRLSQWLTLRYPDSLSLYIALPDIGDESIDAAGVIREAIDGARVCDGGRIFPRRMNRSTTPRLWAAKQEALRIQDDYHYCVSRHEDERRGGFSGVVETVAAGDNRGNGAATWR